MRTSNQISRIGFGGAPIGNLYEFVSEENTQKALEESWEQGLRYFDTAPLYGYGLSEQRLGKFLSKYPRSEYQLSTKVGRLVVGADEAGVTYECFKHGLPLKIQYDYSYDGVMRSFEASLKRLNISYLDTVFIHDIGFLHHGKRHPEIFKTALESGYAALSDLKAQGLINAIGLGVREWQICVQAMEVAKFDCFMVQNQYTLLEQPGLLNLFPQCAQKGISIYIAGPFCSGILATGSMTDATYAHTKAPKEIIERVQSLESICQEYAVPLAAVALQFPLHHPVVRRVVVGIRNKEEIQKNAALLKVKIPERLWGILKKHKIIHQDCPVEEYA